MVGDGARSKDWISAREHHPCLTDTIFEFMYEPFQGLILYFIPKDCCLFCILLHQDFYNSIYRILSFV